MMGIKQRDFGPLAGITSDALVPADHFYRHLDQQLDLSFVRDLVENRYAPGGCPSIDPVVFFKLQRRGATGHRALSRSATDALRSPAVPRTTGSDRAGSRPAAHAQVRAPRPARGRHPPYPRHTFAKRVLEAGTPAVTVARLLGHTSVETTAIYTQPGWEDRVAAVERRDDGG